jgi:hypothetical protein
MSEFIKRCLEDVVLKQDSDIILSIFKRKQIYIENKKPRARDTYILIAEEWCSGYEYLWYHIDNFTKNHTIRKYKGTLQDIGKKEHSYDSRCIDCICGIFYEGDFYPIFKLTTFYYILNMIKNEEILTKLKDYKK